MVLSKMVATAQRRFKDCGTIREAVVTVPAFFNDGQRQATLDACYIAGLDRDKVRIISEPIAAAMAYGFHRFVEDGEVTSRIVFVFDLGGGTLDVTIISLSPGLYEVKATGGDNHLGGVDFDNNLVKFCELDFRRRNKVPTEVVLNPRGMRRLRTSCEEAKITLSSAESATITAEGLLPDKPDLVYEHKIFRGRFCALNEGLLEKCLKTIDTCLDGFDKTQVDEVVLIGGSTRIPSIIEMVQKYFPSRAICNSINPDEAVAYGAALHAASLSDRPGHKALQAVLVDRSTASLGIQVSDVDGINKDIMSIIIPRNTVVPTMRDKQFYTCKDNQTSILITVYEGENTTATENQWLGEVSIKGLAKGRQGTVSVTVTFDIGSNGILIVSVVNPIANGGKPSVIEIRRGRLDPSALSAAVAGEATYQTRDRAVAHQERVRSRLDEVIDFLTKGMKDVATANALSANNRKVILYHIGAYDPDSDVTIEVLEGQLVTALENKEVLIIAQEEANISDPGDSSDEGEGEQEEEEENDKEEGKGEDKVLSKEDDGIKAKGKRKVDDDGLKDDGKQGKGKGNGGGDSKEDGGGKKVKVITNPKDEYK